jgi:hypothetical protein
MSRFRIVIRDTETGDDAVLVPGSTGERDLIRAVTDAQVKKAIDTAVREVLLDMKREVKSVRR